MSTAVATQPVVTPAATPSRPREVVLFSHSPIFYWWPVWAVGYVFAVMTYFQGVEHTFKETTVLIHPSRSLGASLPRPHLCAAHHRLRSAT